MELLFSRDPAFKIAITSTISFRNSDVIFRISNFVGKSLKVRKKIYFSLHGKNCSKGVFFFPIQGDVMGGNRNFCVKRFDISLG